MLPHLSANPEGRQFLFAPVTKFLFCILTETRGQDTVFFGNSHFTIGNGMFKI